MTSCLSNLDVCKAECCRYFVIKVKDMTADMKKYYELHGCKIKNGKIIIPMVCSMLDKNNKCKIHFRGKPDICKRGYDKIVDSRVSFPDKCIFKRPEHE